jgi:exopolysaccharide/PEP-CTERM locus tyrosine autokinase
MDLIEQAAKRLEQLRQAGLDLPPAAQATKAPPQRGAEDELSRQKRNKDENATNSKPITIDLEALAAAGFSSPVAPRARIADEFRIIKRPLIANAFGKGAVPIADGNLIMVTSALPGEGKTFTAINLALSIATELDTTVMLVDADVARPSVLNTLGLPPSRGLLDVLVDSSVDLSDVLLKTNVENLTLLPSGTQHERATELLASEAMMSLLKEMSSRYSDRIIIFDSPPLLLTTESRALATHMGQIVMVVRADSTLRADVEQALSTIEACPVKLAVLNQARNEGLGGKYGYGYGYGYGNAA